MGSPFLIIERVAPERKKCSLACDLIAWISASVLQFCANLCISCDTSLPESAAMAKYLITTLVLAASALADDTSAYAAPAGGYAAPSPSYAPSAPAGYGAPEPSYGAPAAEYSDAYEQPYDTYEAAVDDGGELFDLSKILELLPLFLAVFAAIIVAQLFAPLLGVLFDAKVNLFGGLLNPISSIKIDAINAILGPFNLALCDTSGAALALATGRSSASGFQMNKDVVDQAANFLYKAIQEYS